MRKIVMLLVIAIASSLPAATAGNSVDLKADLYRKISVYQAKGELTDRQIITFKERLQAVSKQTDANKKTRELIAVNTDLEKARKKAKRIASRFFGLW